jgi:hypothetical protein
MPDPFLRSAGGISNDIGLGVATDNSGNVFFTGAFQGSALFDTELLTSNGGNDIFLAKYSSNGTLQWVIQAGGLGSDAGWAIEIDPLNNVMITGDFSNRAFFEDITLTALGSTDVFLAKYTTNGELIWVESAGGLESDTARSLDIDSMGDAIVTGSFRNSATFGGIRLRSEPNGHNMYIAKFDRFGRALWAEQSTGTGDSDGFGVVLDSQNNSYVTGDFSGEISFEDRSITPTNVFTITSNGENDIFIAKFDIDGDVQLVSRAGGPGTDGGTGIAIDTSSNFYVSGFFRESVDFEGTNIASLGGRDMFLAKYNNTGVFQWVEHGGGSGDDLATGVAVTNSGNVSLTGRFESTWQLDNRLISSEGGSDILIAQYNNAGILEWAIDAGGSGSDSPRGLTTDSGNNTFVTGFFSDSADFDDFAEISVGGLDIFLAKFDQNGFLRP